MTDVEDTLRDYFQDAAGQVRGQVPDPASIRAAAAAGRRRRVVGSGVGLMVLIVALALALPGWLRGPEPLTAAGAETSAAGSASHGVDAAAVQCGSPDHPATTVGRIPDTLGRVRAAYVCVSEERPVAGDGVWSFTEVRRVTGGLDTVLAAYHMPDTAEQGPGCALLRGYDRHLLHLQTDSGVVTVREPVDGCGVPSPTALAAFRP